MLFCKSLCEQISLNVKATCTLLILFVFNNNVFAADCSSYVTNQPFAQQANTPIYSNINTALNKSSSGAIICFKEGGYGPVKIKNIDGGNKKIVIRSNIESKASINNTDFTGAGIYIENSKNLVLSGFDISGGLYGIYAIGSSDLNIVNNTISGVGQEGIIVKSGESTQDISNIAIIENEISNTGKSNSTYGEGIYVGDGNNAYNKIIDTVNIKGNTIHHTTNEAIDIKINTTNVNVTSNTIYNIDLKFNGAITVGTSNRYAENINISIEDNSIRHVANRSGYRPIGIALGQGNARIANNRLVEKDKRFVGICLFSTFVNKNANTVVLGTNHISTEGVKILHNCTDGGTGSHALATVISN